MQGYNVWEQTRHFKKAMLYLFIIISSTDQRLTNERELAMLPATYAVTFFMSNLTQIEEETLLDVRLKGVKRSHNNIRVYLKVASYCILKLIILG